MERKEHVDVYPMISLSPLQETYGRGLLVRTKTISVTIDRHSLILLVFKSIDSVLPLLCAARMDIIFAGAQEQLYAAMATGESR